MGANTTRNCAGVGVADVPRLKARTNTGANAMRLLDRRIKIPKGQRYSPKAWHIFSQH